MIQRKKKKKKGLYGCERQKCQAHKKKKEKKEQRGQKTLWPEYHNFLPNCKLFYFVVFIKNWLKMNLKHFPSQESL